MWQKRNGIGLQMSHPSFEIEWKGLIISINNKASSRFTLTEELNEEDTYEKWPSLWDVIDEDGIKCSIKMTRFKEKGGVGRFRAIYVLYGIQQ